MRPRGPGERHRAGDGLASCMARATPACPLNTMVALPELRERAPVQRIHNQHSSACVGVLVHQTGHSQREVVADGRRCRSLPRHLDPRGRFLKATCLGQPLCVEPDAICEIRPTRDAPTAGTRSYLAVGWSVTNAGLTMALWPVRPLGR